MHSHTHTCVLVRSLRYVRFYLVVPPIVRTWLFKSWCLLVLPATAPPAAWIEWAAAAVCVYARFCELMVARGGKGKATVVHKASRLHHHHHKQRSKFARALAMCVSKMLNFFFIYAIARWPPFAVLLLLLLLFVTLELEIHLWRL